MSARPAPAPDVYGETAIYVCRCVVAHGVRHVCRLCRGESDHRPTDPWVEAERCRACLVEEHERLEAELAVVARRLRLAVHPIDGATGERIPPLFLTAQGWKW